MFTPAPQAEAALRRILRKIYPDLEEGKDYRIPSPSTFKEWRDFLKPVCEFISADALSKCEKV
jgi:hypothetical protein